MGPGFRYHVVTLVAVFLALGVGIVIGTSTIREAVMDRLSVQLRDLNTRYNTEVGPLRRENRLKSEALSLLAPYAITGHLKGMTIAVVQTGDYSDALQKAKEALTDAGAAVGTTTVLGPTFRARLDLAAPNVLPKLRASHPAIANDWTGIVRILALAIAKGAPDQDVRSISETRAVEVDGRYDAPADCVIVVGGCSGDQESRTDTVDIPLVEQLLDLGAIVVGAEPEAAVVSYVPAYNRAGITTVDNVDTELGRVALVLSVRGRRGSYGTKPTARNGAFPPMEAPQ